MNLIKKLFKKDKNEVDKFNQKMLELNQALIKEGQNVKI